MIKKVSFILSFTVLLISCGSAVYEENKDVSELGWHKDSVYIFETDSLSTLPDAVVFGVNLRNTIDYKYRNFWCYMSIKLPNGKEFTDTIDHSLMTHDGYWLKNVEGSNAIKSSNIFFKYPINNPESGKYTITLQHAMRNESLEDIVSVSAFIREFKKQ
jgi:gliding motility-associated lipoprotein GldH